MRDIEGVRDEVVGQNSRASEAGGYLEGVLLFIPVFGIPLIFRELGDIPGLESTLCNWQAMGRAF